MVCGSGSLALREAAKAAKISVVDNVMIDLTNGGDDTFATHGTSGSSSWNTPNPGSSADGKWTCPVCTLINADLALQCDACLAVRHAEKGTYPMNSGLVTFAEPSGLTVDPIDR